MAPPRLVTVLEALRIGWTIATGLGLAVMLYLLREVWLDDQAIKQVRPPRADFLRMNTSGEVWDHALLAAKMFSLFLAGILAFTVDTFWPILPIVFSAFLLVVLGFSKWQRRRRIFRTLRLNREAQ